MSSKQDLFVPQGEFQVMAASVGLVYMQHRFPQGPLLAEALDAVQPDEALALLEVDVRDESVSGAQVGHLDHLDARVAEQLDLVVDKLPEEAVVGVHHGAPRLEVAKRVAQPHAVVLHEVGQAERGRARGARHAMHEHAAAAHVHVVDVLGHGVEIDGHVEVGRIVHAHAQELDVVGTDRHVGEVGATVDDGRNADGAHCAERDGTEPAQVQVVRHLGDNVERHPPQQRCRLLTGKPVSNCLQW